MTLKNISIHNFDMNAKVYQIILLNKYTRAFFLKESLK